MSKKSISRTPKQLLAENKDLRARLDEAEETLRAIRSGEVDALIVSGEGGEQIYTLKQVEEALRVSEEKFRGLVEGLPSVVYMTAVGDASTTLYVSPQITAQLGYTPEEWLADPGLLSKTLHPEDRHYILTEVADSDRSNKPFDKEYRRIARDGHLVWVHDQSLLLNDLEGKPKFRQGIMLDISARKQVEEALRVSEEKYRTLVDEVNDGFYATDKAGVFTFANPALARIYGVESPQALVGRKFSDFIAPEILAELGEARRSTMHTGRASEVINGQIVRPDGTCAFIEVKPTSIVEASQIVGSRGVVRDVTERKRAEQEIDRLARFPSENPNPVLRLSRDGIVMYANAASSAIMSMWGCAVGGSAPQFWRDLAAQGLVSRENKTVEVECDGKVYSMFVTPVVEPGYVNLYGREITERKQAEQEIARQLERLEALHTIDLTINASTDLRMTLNILLEHVKTQLNADAADVLLLNPHLLTLEFAAGRGFKSRAVERTSLRIGEGQAGRAALERHMIQLPDFAASGAAFAQSELLAAENVASYFAVPLITKGQVKGVLEVFHRTPLQPDSEWLNFLETLAGQAAIAIDSAQLFENLQRSNSDLGLAYDATIEGWSHALDLRDKETEGHTQRVTEITLRLAIAMGIGDAELVHIRRGALLHDIGKMGVPDGILLKPSKLTDEEWVLMRKHPQLAYDLLSPIAYLKPALDIPYCHHEKWDGTGYPRGLKGNQIPLAARLFAIVDVWDALRSDRPYRKAWDEEKVREHILAGSGTHFDPMVVETFLRVITGE